MKRFAALYKALDTSTGTLDKVDALARYFDEAPPADAAWAIAMLSGRRPKRLIKAGELHGAIAELTGLPDWLVEHSYAHVGDFAETLALLAETVEQPDADHVAPHDGVGGGAAAPADSERAAASAEAATAASGTNHLPALADFVENELRTLPNLDEGQRRERILLWWTRADRDTRFLVNKLITGAFRVGVSQRLVTQGLAKSTGLPVELLAERLAGEWQPDAAFHAQLTAPADASVDLGSSQRPYPFFLASPLETEPATLGAVNEWLAEWKWDGIRAQLIRRGDALAVWSRGEGRLDGRFPEVESVASTLVAGTVLDGEILAWRDDAPLPFTALQKRIGRLKPGAKSLAEQPVAFVCYDLLELGGDDLREKPLAQRRTLLERVIAGIDHPAIRVSPIVQAESWDALATLRETSRERGVEGLMLKRLDSPYRAGRKRGDWWKWKVDPYTLDCVLVYAQPGSGRRATLYTDYTFAVWDGDALVPVAKAYSGLTDAEIAELDRWIRSHTRERFGPVRSLEPVQVFELGFEAIHVSSRHKSGVAVRFPRILRWRRDKPAAEAETLDDLKRMAGFGTG
jgi:DNA ligase-1